MKYKLIKPINPLYSTTEQILTNRGIDINEIKHYLNTTDKDINEPELFGQNVLRNAAALIIQTVKANLKTVVVVDCDCDGYTSAAILINYLHDLFPAYVENNLFYFVHDSKTHGLSDCWEWAAEKVEYNGLIICPDSSSNDYAQHKYLKEHGMNVIVLDHHDAEKISEDAVVINNQLCNYPNKEFSGAGVTWQFCRYIDKLLHTNYAESYIDLVALGLKYLG